MRFLDLSWPAPQGANPVKPPQPGANHPVRATSGAVATIKGTSSVLALCLAMPSVCRGSKRAMRALVLHDFTGPDGITLEDIAPPEPAPGRVVIDVHAAGVSFADMLICQGLYQKKPDLPFVPGLEVAGTVRSAPPGSRFAPGARVAGYEFGGAFADQMAIDEDWVVPMPEKLDFAEAAGLIVNYQTAIFALDHRAGLRAGENVLVHGAGGGLGTATVAVAKALGAHVVGTASSPEKAEAARASGADVVVDPGADDWAAQVREATGGAGIDVVIDPVGGDRFDDTVRLLRPEGRLVVVGFTGGAIPSIKVNRLLLRNATVMGSAWREFVNNNRGYLAEAGAELNLLIDTGRLATPIVGARYALEDAPQAMRDLGDRKGVGKVVIAVR